MITPTPSVVTTIVRWDGLDPVTHLYEHPLSAQQVGADSVTVEVVTDRSGTFAKVNTNCRSFDRNGAFKPVGNASWVPEVMRPTWATDMVDQAKDLHVRATSGART